MPGTSPPWQKRPRREGTPRRVQRDNAVHEWGEPTGGSGSVHSDLRDRWADTPGESLRASPELLQLCGASGPAAVAPPANLGNTPSADAAVLQLHAAFLELYRKLRVYHTHLDKVFALFCSSNFSDGRFLEDTRWCVVCEHLMEWKAKYHGNHECAELSDLLEPGLLELAEAEYQASFSTTPPTTK